MSYILACVIGALAGAACVYFLVTKKLEEISERQAKLASEAEAIATSRSELTDERTSFAEKRSAFDGEVRLFEARRIGLTELETENRVLKQTLRSVELTTRQISLARDTQGKRQLEIDEKVDDLGRRYLKDNVKWIGNSLNQNNFVSCRERLEKVIAAVREIGVSLTAKDEQQLIEDLRQEYQSVVRAAMERERQAALKAQIREEEKQRRELERERERAEAEQKAVEAALVEALAKAKDQHSAEIEALRAQLAEAQAKTQRTISMAEQTKVGHVYVISNIGSFGEGVYKVGMTRRLDPIDRITELGDASVPFPFDIHMMISSDDAPALENALHRSLHTLRVNRVNPRKEFFRVALDAIVRVVESEHGKVEYVADAQALQYRQSLSASPEDLEFIEETYEAADDPEAAIED